MKNLTPSSVAHLAFVLLGLGVTPLANAAYVFTVLAPADGYSSTASSINNAGQIVGSSFTSTSLFSYPLGSATYWASNTSPVNFGTGLASFGGGSAAKGINNTGQIAGYGHGAVAGYSDPSRAALWSGGTITNLGTPITTLSGNQAAPMSVATAINDAGLVAGYTNYVAGSSGLAAALWNGNTIQLFHGRLGDSFAYGLNNVGQIVGSAEYDPLSSKQEAILWNGNGFTELLSLGGYNSYAYGINDAGLTVGTAELTSGSSDRHATLWNGNVTTDLGISGGKYSVATDLGTLGGNYSVATAINSTNKITGFSLTTGNTLAISTTTGYSNQHATLWDGGTLIDLNDYLDAAVKAEGWQLISANDINDNGWVVGNAYNIFTSQRYGFLLSTVVDPIIVPPVGAGPATGVPEPATHTLLLAALGLLGFMSWRRKN